MNSKAYPTSFRADLGTISRSFRLWTVVAAIFSAITVSSLVAAFAGNGFGAEAYAAENQTVVVSAADARIVEDAPATNYGRATTAQVDGDDPDGSGKDKSGLIKWDLSGLPAGSKTTSASVSVNITDASVNTYQAYALRGRGLSRPRPGISTAAACRGR